MYPSRHPHVRIGPHLFPSYCRRHAHIPIQPTHLTVPNCTYNMPDYVRTIVYTYSPPALHIRSRICVSVAALTCPNRPTHLPMLGNANIPRLTHPPMIGNVNIPRLTHLPMHGNVKPPRLTHLPTLGNVNIPRLTRGVRKHKGSKRDCAGKRDICVPQLPHTSPR